MNIGFNSETGSPAVIEDNIFTFSCAKPIIVQPSEIKKVQTGITLQVEPGFVLNIVSAPSIYEHAAEVFPGPYVLDSSVPKKSLEIPIRNHGRNPLHLMIGSVIARGYLTKIAEISIKEIGPVESKKRTMERTRPSKKNTDIKFEVR